MFCFNSLDSGLPGVSGLTLAPKHLGVYVFFDLVSGIALLVFASHERLLCVCQRLSASRCLPHFGRRNYFWREQPLRAAVGLVLLAALVLPLHSSGAQAEHVDEYREKATFLAAFPKFIEWPPGAFPSPEAPLLLCVFGDFSFGTSLAESTRASVIRGRRVEVRWAHKEQDLHSCQILFVSKSEAKRYGRVFKALEGASVLTVGETPDFLASGGAIGFLVEQDRLQFEVNMSAASDAHLRISSNMLALARHVIAKTEATKS